MPPHLPGPGDLSLPFQTERQGDKTRSAAYCPPLPRLKLLHNPEDDEFGRLQRRDSDIQYDSTIIDVVPVHRSAIATKEESLIGPVARQGPVSPRSGQEILHALPHRNPQGFVVRLEHGPPQSFFDRRLQEHREAPHVHELPDRVRRIGSRQGARALCRDRPAARRSRTATIRPAPPED